MEKFADMIVKNKKAIIIFFVIAAVIGAALQFFVGVNYNMVDYLPANAQSTKALSIMNEEFGGAMPNARVMVKNVSVAEALEYKSRLAAVNGVTNVTWLDDMVDIKQPLEMGDVDTIESFYKNGSALFSVTVTKGMEQEASTAIRELIGEDNAVTGEAMDLAAVQWAAGSASMGAMIILVPIIIIILALSTTSLIEPVLFLAAIGVSILINMGTNIFFGEVSFITYSVSPILQLACSLDYAIFLIHSFGANREKYSDVNEAMRHSIKESMSTIAASASTTLFGFLALVFMNFRIGADLGINLAKGIVLSFIAAMIFLPAITLSVYKLIDKTKHREWMPGFKNIYKTVSKLTVPAIVLVAVLIVPCFMGQSRTNFLYGAEGAAANSRIVRDGAAIADEFGKTTTVVLLVPRGDVVKERDLSRDIRRFDHVTGVMSFADTVGTAIPAEYLDSGIVSQFYGENYARIIIYTDTPTEGDVAFNTVQSIQDAAAAYYGDAVYSLGQSVNLYDMKTLVLKDNTVVNLIAIFAILGVLFVTFKSATLPFILLITIETGIWVNLSIPYFSGTSINFIGYLVLCTVQLGATIDYAILLTTSFLRNRREMPKLEAIGKSMGETFKSILVSGLTLSTAGFTLYLTSANPAISDIGLLLGRGTLLSVLMVTCFLPAALVIFDGVIGGTTYKARFFKTGKAKYKGGRA